MRTRVRTQELSARPRAGRPGVLALAGWAGVAGPVLFTLSFLTQEAFRRDEYSPMIEVVSALEAGPNGWIQQVTFVVFGVLTMVHAAGLHLGLRPTPGGVAGPAFLFLSGIGAIIAGFVPLREDPAGVTYDPGGHVVGGTLFFLASPVALIVLSRRLGRDPGWRGLAPYTLACGVLLVVSAVVMNVLVIPDDAPLHDRAGLIQRLVVVVVLFPARGLLGARLVTSSRSADE